MGEYTSATLNGVTLRLTSITPSKQQKTRKDVIGKSLIEMKIIGMATQQWSIQMGGIVTGTTSANLSTNRANIEALDTAETYTYVDGIHDGTFYVVPGTLRFTDTQNDAGTGMLYRYSLIIVEE